jgi:hypothetical protein
MCTIDTLKTQLVASKIAALLHSQAASLGTVLSPPVATLRRHLKSQHTTTATVKQDILMLYTGQYYQRTDPIKFGTNSYLPFLSCNNEERLCLGATIIDYDFVNDYNCWYSICDPIIRNTPKLPPLSSITAPYDVDFRKTANSACIDMKNSRSLCEIEYTSGDPTTSASRCFCSPPVLSLEYTCSFLGNISCGQVPAHFTRMTGWTICNNFDSVLTVPPSVVSNIRPKTTC